MMVVVATISILAAIAIPSFLRARKRSQATLVKNDLRVIDNALQQYAIETNKKSGAAVFVSDWVDYVKDNTRLADYGLDIFGHDYADQLVDRAPVVPALTYDALSDVADTAFWEPYLREVTPLAKHKKAPKPPKGG